MLRSLRKKMLSLRVGLMSLILSWGILSLRWVMFLLNLRVCVLNEMSVSDVLKFLRVSFGICVSRWVGLNLSLLMLSIVWWC